MENRLKERLTGAAILVALIVLLVPEMFHGQRGDVAATPGAATEGPPLRSYTIDLSNGPARTAPLQSTPAPNAGNGLGESAAEAPPHPLNSPGVQNAPIAAEVPGRQESSPAPAERAATGAHAAATGWTVQLGMFAQRENAQRLMHAAQAKGFEVNLSTPDGKGLFRVRSGTLADHAAAEELQQRLRGQGFAAAVVPP